MPLRQQQCRLAAAALFGTADGAASSFGEARCHRHPECHTIGAFYTAAGE